MITWCYAAVRIVGCGFVKRRSTGTSGHPDEYKLRAPVSQLAAAVTADHWQAIDIALDQVCAARSARFSERAVRLRAAQTIVLPLYVRRSDEKSGFWD
jgi:hypothetical protein